MESLYFDSPIIYNSGCQRPIPDLYIYEQAALFYPPSCNYMASLLFLIKSTYILEPINCLVARVGLELADAAAARVMQYLIESKQTFARR
jgi:hypothetical protein